MIGQFWRFVQVGTVLAIAGVASISTAAYAELIVSPEAVIMAGDRASAISTTLTLSDDKGNVPLKTAVSDLRRADGAAFIPANGISIAPAEITVPNGAPAQITLTVDLAKASAGGEFVGSLYLYRNDGRQVIPLTVRVKEAPILPWLVMLAGVGLGTLLSLYRMDGRSRDEIVVRVGRLQNQMNSDPKLNKDFRASIESKLARASSAIEDKDWEAAKADVLAARNLWSRWGEFRDDWIAQLRYGEQLVEENKDFKTKPLTIFLQGVKDNADSVYRKLRAGQYEAPQALSEDFSEIRQQLSFYRVGHAAVDKLKERRQKLREDRRDDWLDMLNALATELDSSNPSQESRDSWQSAFDEAQKALEEEIAASRKEVSSEADSTIRGRSGVGMLETEQVPLVPSISVVATSQLADKAERNLWWFNQTSRCVAIIFLAWLGMIELYSGKPTFGAEPMRDYFALLAWGFGAELTRESIARASQNLGVPFGNQ